MKTIERIETLLKNGYVGAPFKWEELTHDEDYALEHWVDQLQNGQRVTYEPATDSFILPPTGLRFRRVILERLVRCYYPKADIQF